MKTRDRVMIATFPVVILLYIVLAGMYIYGLFTQPQMSYINYHEEELKDCQYKLTNK